MYISTSISSAEGVGQFASCPKAKKQRLRTDKTILLAVKLTAFLLLIGFLHLSARTTAQQRISITLKGATLEKVFAEIEKRSGFTVFYNVEVLKAAGTVSIDIKDATIEDVMRQCLKGLPLEFTVQEKTIFVKKEARKISADFSVEPANPPPQTVSGVVKSSDGQPLAGATVMIIKLKKSGQTNAKGEFSLKGVPDGQYELEISFVGYERYKSTITVSDHAAWVDVAMNSGTGQLDETVVKGYYNTTSRLNTGDVTTVRAEEIEKQPVSDPILALDGRVPGLYIQQTSGVPGSYGIVRIMGQNSIANGNNPFYVVDGVPYNSQTTTSGLLSQGVLGIPNPHLDGIGASPFNDLNPADIESIEVLKDADATAIYGSRGANGVILITTKKGKAGVTQFSVNAFSGTGKVSHYLHFMNTSQYLAMRHEALLNDGSTLGFYDFDLNGEWDSTRYTNWQKLLIGKPSRFDNLEATLSGGNATTQFRINGGYSKQGTVYPGSFSDQKGMTSLNLTHVSINQRLHVQLTANYVYENNNLPQADLTSYANLSPNAPPPFDAFGNLNWQPVNGNASWQNPYAYLQANAYGKIDNLIGNLNLDYTILRGLQLKANLGYSHTQNNQTNLYFRNFNPPPYNLPIYRANSFATTDFRTWVVEPQITYAKNILRGKFDILIGSTFQQNSQNTSGFSAYGFSSDALVTDPQAAQTVQLLGYNSTLYHYAAAFGRIGYNWDGKYILNITARRDGSSRFGPGKQFGNFGAIGAGWVFSSENFVQSIIPVLSFGKIRVSYGSTGNDQIGDYQYLSTYSVQSQTYQGLTGLSPTGFNNPKFSWEVVKKLESAVELGFFKNRIMTTASYYMNRTGNQLVGYSLPQFTGFGSVVANLPATVENYGGEFTLKTVNVRSKSFSWTTSFNLTLPKNKLVSFYNFDSSNYVNSYSIGKSLFVRKLFHFAGVNDTTGAFQYVTGKGASDNPAYPDDLKATKPITQHWYGGFENNFSYKGFELGILIQFVNQTGYNYFANGYGAGQINNNELTAVFNHWKMPGDVVHYARYSAQGAANPNGALGNSDFDIANTSFIRLKNASFSYHLPKDWLKKLCIQNLRLYIQAQNLFVITHHYLGYDPENGGTTLPPLRMITTGIQLVL